VSNTASAGSAVNLPYGVQVSPGRETTQVGPSNVAVPGMNFTLTLPSGAMTTVFVSYAMMAYPDQVSALFAQRVAGIDSITALGS
jgi:hypothetical protein